MPASSPLRSLLLLVPACSLLWLISGCSSESAKSSAEKPTAAEASPSSESAAANRSSTETSQANNPSAQQEPENAPQGAAPTLDPKAPFELGNALEKFDPPSLEELDKLKWNDGRIADGMALLRDEKSGEPAPVLTAEEALKLRNDSPENNAKILAALGVLQPEGGEGVNFDAKMIRHAGGDLNSTNPLFSSSVTDGEFADLTGLAIMSFDRQLKNFAPKDVVVSWQTSDDGLIDRFVLRDDITWSDGKPFTAYDVEFTFKLIMSDHALLVIPAVRGSGTDQIKAVKAYDDDTVVIFHKEALATNITNINFPILPKHIYENSVKEDPSLKRSAYHTEQEAKPVTAGPYEYVSRKRGEEFVVRRRESYYMHDGKQVRDKPNFAEVRVKTIEDLNTALLALKSGDIQQMELRAEQWADQTNGADFYAKNTKVTAPEWTEFHIEWNQRTADGKSPSPFFGDSRVRWAMTYAMDYDELINTITRGLYQQGQGTFHPTSWMFPKNPPALIKQDLDKAEDLLAEAGWTDSDGDGIRDKEINGQIVPFEFQLMTSQTETGIQTATLMKECLEQIGVIANVKPTEFVVMQDKLIKHEFDASLGGWGAGTDPSMQSNIYGTGAQRNYGQYSNPKVDKLFEQGVRELDPAKRAEIYGQIHLQLWEDQPVTWLFYRNAFFGFNKTLRGYNFGALGPFKYSPGFSSLFVPAATP
ncbi:MAG: peptide ABC transporter substrate-binding protein [Planctomycetaceae bacterium]|nr:peptide ABC transporter substrate-binding protein [Planctomycetaceae bacterium]